MNDPLLQLQRIRALGSITSDATSSNRVRCAATPTTASEA